MKSNCECAQEFLDRNAEDFIAEKPLGSAIEQDAPRFGIVRRECLESGKILWRESCRVFHFNGVESVFAINYEIDFLLSRDAKIVPIEVKSSAYKTHVSMDEFRKKYSSRIANDRYLIYTKDYFKDGALKYLPAYLAYFL